MTRLTRAALETERRILAAIDAQARPLVRQIARRLATVSRSAADAVREGRDPLAALAGFQGELQRMVAPRLANVADTGAQTILETARMMETKDAETFAAERLLWAQRHAASQVKGVTDSVRTLINRRVQRALQRNTPPRELAKQLQQVLGGQSAVARANRIARTELHNAASYGQFQEASRLQQRTGQRYVKVWRSTRDPRTRRTHRLADGQSRPINDPFVVGGREMMHPGDSNGGPANVINCRCTMTVVPERAAALDGNPVVRRTSRGVRAELGQLHLEGRNTGRMLQLQRGGELPERAAGKLYDTMGKEALTARRTLAAPQTMSAAERRAFEALGRRRDVRIVRDADLPDGAITAHPRPPMLMQLVSEVDDTLLFNDLLALLMHGLDEVPA